MSRILESVRTMVRTVGMETAVIIALNAIIPIGSLAWSLWGSFGFWSDVFGSTIMALGAMIVIESVALIGFVLHVADWAPGSWIRWSRHCLPFIPSFQLLHSVHAAVAPAPFSVEAARWLDWTPDAASWAISAAFTAIFAVISFGAWESFGESLRNRHAWKIRRIQRDLERSRQEIETAMLRRNADREITRWREEADLTVAVSGLRDELGRLQARIPLTRALLEAQQARLSAVRSALQTLARQLPPDSPVSESLRELSAPSSPPSNAHVETLPGAAPAGEADDDPATGHDPRQRYAVAPLYANGATAPAGDDAMNDDLNAAPTHVLMACAVRLLMAGASQHHSARVFGLKRTTLQGHVNRAGGNLQSLLDEYLACCDDREMELYQRLSARALSSVPPARTFNGVPTTTA